MQVRLKPAQVINEKARFGAADVHRLKPVAATGRLKAGHVSTRRGYGGEGDFIFKAALAHGDRDWPRECCGILVDESDPSGSVSPAARRDSPYRVCFKSHDLTPIIAVVPITNCATGRDEFELDPFELAAAERAARRIGGRVIGHYHSHPCDSPAPSDRDRAATLWPGIGPSLHLIVSPGERSGALYQILADGSWEQIAAFQPPARTIADVLASPGFGPLCATHHPALSGGRGRILLDYQSSLGATPCQWHTRQWHARSYRVVP